MDTSTVVCGANHLDVNALTCPVCGKPGKEVRSETIKNIVKEECLPTVNEGFFLCLSKDCKVIYFGNQIYFKPDVKVKVWFKEEDNPSVPLCYCKNVSKEDICNHIAFQKCCSDLKNIQEHTGATTGKECLTKNPAGT
ncbi:MAG: (2Fe-2S)-binding protein [Peptococcaceae bacterium BRH_c8a]|nr:MAG: (2Fe-2S)-binding protein [Peptococcaceae bacterium BRH_c8a]